MSNKTFVIPYAIINCEESDTNGHSSHGSKNCIQANPHSREAKAVPQELEGHYTGPLGLRMCIQGYSIELKE